MYLSMSPFRCTIPISTWLVLCPVRSVQSAAAKGAWPRERKRFRVYGLGFGRAQNGPGSQARDFRAWGVESSGFLRAENEGLQHFLA